MEVRKTEAFDIWLNGLRDREARARIIKRLLRVESGNFGDHAGVGDGVMELRFFFGPGYRVYFVQRGAEIVILLGGGDKDSQATDIDKAKALARHLQHC